MIFQNFFVIIHTKKLYIQLFRHSASVIYLENEH